MSYIAIVAGVLIGLIGISTLFVLTVVVAAIGSDLRRIAEALENADKQRRWSWSE